MLSLDRDGITKCYHWPCFPFPVGTIDSVWISAVGCIAESIYSLEDAKKPKQNKKTPYKIIHGDWLSLR